jgi:LPS-assembly lipoprotein
MRIKRGGFFALVLTITMLLSACGFQLRGSSSQANLPFKTVYLSLPDTSPLGNELRRYLRANGDVAIATDAKSAQAVIDVLSETRQKVILTLNTQGRVREYSLFYRITFRVKDAADKELLAPTEIVLKRDMSFNEAQAIAKEKEEELLYRDMQSDLVQQILRRLAAIKPT